MASVSLEQHDGVHLVRVDRPPVNALDLELLGELAEVAGELKAQRPRAIVLAGRERCFSAGLDLKQARTFDQEGRRRAATGINQVVRGWYSLASPVVGALTGHAIAGGMVLALCADLRVGSSEGRYGLTEVQVGVPYPAGAIAVVSAELAAPSARQLALRGNLIDAARAQQLGLIDEVTAPERVIARSLELARELAQPDPAIYAATKRGLRGALVAELQDIVAADPLVSGAQAVEWLA